MAVVGGIGRRKIETTVLEQQFKKNQEKAPEHGSLRFFGGDMIPKAQQQKEK